MKAMNAVAAFGYLVKLNARMGTASCSSVGFPTGPTDPRVGERNPDPEPQRIGQEEDQEPHRRQHEPETEPVAVGPELVPRRRLADLRLGEAGLQCDVGH